MSMLSLLVVLWIATAGCQAQYVYGVVPYVVRRAPARRSAIEALERLRYPPRVYQPQPVYALPPEWNEEDEDYGNYEYEPLPPLSYEPEPEEIYSRDSIERRSDTHNATVSTPTQVEKKSSGQKEEPLFRPQQNSQRTTWNTRTEKSPIPLLKQMIQKDPLTEELDNLRKKQ